ncbi:hypothetical protein [Actinoplanes philippinensis]|uniref:hypothetical protein n=1 Tax=Actinoplanes philippinensis TaxID=35752 RepID=UPI0033FC407C
MPHADLTQSAWNALSDEAATRVARAVAAGAGATLAHVGPHSYAGRSGRVAFLDRDGLRFALVPGGTVDLGFDPSRCTLTARQAAHFTEAAQEWGLSGSPLDFIAASTSAARRVDLPARLVAVRATASEELIDDEDEEADGHDWVIAGLRARGLRPPTPDEWEHACGAGATTLFRWGDDYPDGEPYGTVPLIQDPNLFGLVIAADPYASEFTTDPEVFCGGDGGAALCGGYGSFLSWLTLATAYREATLAETVVDGGLTEETPVRPVIEIP